MHKRRRCGLSSAWYDFLILHNKKIASGVEYSHKPRADLVRTSEDTLRIKLIWPFRPLVMLPISQTKELLDTRTLTLDVTSMKLPIQVHYVTKPNPNTADTHYCYHQPSTKPTQNPEKTKKIFKASLESIIPNSFQREHAWVYEMTALQSQDSPLTPSNTGVVVESGIDSKSWKQSWNSPEIIKARPQTRGKQRGSQEEEENARGWRALQQQQGRQVPK